jgi:hypothetical protein
MLIACFFLHPYGQAQCDPRETSETVGNIVRHELNLAPQQGRWMYIARYSEDGVRIEARKIQTDDGILTWVLTRNGVPLSPAELGEQKEHLNNLIADSSFLATNRKAMLDDNARINTLLADLPQSVQFECLTKKTGTTTIRFKPLSGASTLNLEKRILSGMGGELQLDLNQMRLLSASGSELDDVALFFGIARVYKGSSVSLTRAQVAPGVWEATQVSTHIKGHVFFLKTIAQDRDESRAEYKPVPSGLSAHDAIRFLEPPGSN